MVGLGGTAVAVPVGTLVATATGGVTEVIGGGVGVCVLMMGVEVGVTVGGTGDGVLVETILCGHVNSISAPMLSSAKSVNLPSKGTVKRPTTFIP